MWSLLCSLALASPVTDAFVAGDCNRCHHVPQVADAERLNSCTGCHIWIKDVAANPARRSVAMEAFPLWERYEKNVASYLQVPNLEAAMARLEPDWVRSYLADPHDLRPGLRESMPRLGLDADQREAIVSAFAASTKPVPKTPAPDPANVDAGRTLFTLSSCDVCHTLGPYHLDNYLPLSPDLAVTRQRMSPDRVVAWIEDPHAVSDKATMPSLPISHENAILLRDYIFLVTLTASPPPPLVPPPAPHDGPVSWAEVESRVFGKICVHCHMKPELNQGRAGPGNAGGFGWPASGIELQTREGVAAVGDKVRAALLRRREEGRRDAVAPGQQPVTLTRPELPGMPLGLPPISDEDLAYVLAWLDQGAPE